MNPNCTKKSIQTNKMRNKIHQSLPKFTCKIQFVQTQGGILVHICLHSSPKIHCYNQSRVLIIFFVIVFILLRHYRPRLLVYKVIKIHHVQCQWQLSPSKRSWPLQGDWRKGLHIVGQSVNYKCSTAAQRPTSLSTWARPWPSTSSSWSSWCSCTVLANEINSHDHCI